MIDFPIIGAQIAAIADLTDDVETLTPNLVRLNECGVYDLSSRQILKKRLSRGVYVIGGKTVRIQ